MSTFIIGFITGVFFGAILMCLANVEIEIDETPEEERCPFCGGQLSEVRTFGDLKVRHCYSCHFDYEVDE